MSCGFVCHTGSLCYVYVGQGLPFCRSSFCFGLFSLLLKHLLALAWGLISLRNAHSNTDCDAASNGSKSNPRTYLPAGLEELRLCSCRMLNLGRGSDKVQLRQNARAIACPLKEYLGVCSGVARFITPRDNLTAQVRGDLFVQDGQVWRLADSLKLLLKMDFN